MNEREWDPVPDSDRDIDPRLARLVADAANRVSRGEDVDWPSLRERHPEFQQQLECVAPMLQALAELSPSRVGDSTSRVATAVTADLRPTEIGTILGDFRILRELGRGGMGIVYEAEQISLSRVVALKVLPLTAVLDSRQLKRFENEAHTAAMLDHPNIVAVYAVGQHQGVHFYVMQRILGQSADRLIEQWRQQPEQDRQVAQLALQAAEALHHAHQNGVIHRDIKPANLLVDSQGHLWVTDFGLARLGQDVGVTITGDVVGTLRYMSPEQARGQSAAVDPRADIYSLGATLYELLTLQPAFGSSDPSELLRQIMVQEPRRPRLIAPAIPRDLETIVLKAMEKRPEDRYASARKLADDLRRFLDQKPILAKRASIQRRIQKWAYRNRVLVTTAVLTLVATLALSSGFLWRGMRTTRTALAQSEANLKILTGLTQDLAQLGHDHEETGTLRDAIAIQEKVVDSITDQAAAAEILAQMLHTYAHLARALKNEGQLEEALQVCTDYWQSVDRRAAFMMGNAPPKAELAGSFESFAATSADLGDWIGAERACRYSIQATHERFQHPPSSETRQLATRLLAVEIAHTIQRLEMQAKDLESLISEYAASVELARELLRQQTASPADPKQAEWIANLQAYLANIERLQGHTDEAVARYHEAFQSLPKTQALPRPLWVGFLYELADVFQRQGRDRDVVGVYREAVDQGRICVAVDPADARFFKNLVIALNEVCGHGNLDESRQACKEMLDRLRAERQRDPEFGKRDDSGLLKALIQLQVVGPYTELYDYPEALACAEQLLEIDPQEQQAWLLLGLAKYRMQDYEGAREWLQKLNSVPMIEDLPKVYLLPTRMGMALTLQKLGKADMAHTYYEQGLAAYQGIADPGTEERAILEEAQRELAVSDPQP